MLELPYGQAAREELLKQAGAGGAIDGEKDLGVAGRYFTFFYEILSAFVKIQESESVGDRGPVLADGFGDLVLRELVEVLESAVGGGFFNRVQVFALEVFDQG